MNNKLFDILSEELEFMKNDKFIPEVENTELLHDYFYEMQTKVGDVYSPKEVIETLQQIPGIYTMLMYPTSENGNLLRTEGNGTEDGIIKEDENDLSLCLSILNLEERAHNTEAFLLGCFTSSDKLVTKTSQVEDLGNQVEVEITTYEEPIEYHNFINEVFSTLPEGFEIYQYPEYNDTTNLDAFKNVCQVISIDKILGQKKLSEYLREVKEYILTLDRDEKLQYVSNYETDIRVMIFNAAYRVKAKGDQDSYQELKEILKLFLLEIFMKKEQKVEDPIGSYAKTTAAPTP